MVEACVCKGEMGDVLDRAHVADLCLKINKCFIRLKFPGHQLLIHRKCQCSISRELCGTITREHFPPAAVLRFAGSRRGTAIPPRPLEKCERLQVVSWKSPSVRSSQDSLPPTKRQLGYRRNKS